MSVCSVPTCPAIPDDGADFCGVHEKHARRADGDVPIDCYACGRLIRKSARYLQRAEGAFHLRTECLTMDPALWATKVIA